MNTKLARGPRQQQAILTTLEEQRIADSIVIARYHG
jgi:hypothetical protein